uniref:C-type lectin domain-containing protein n=1 Tax=Cynoglossus semilaevis TaxID=244447 RepID=A0A3P8V4J4_CYNSE
MDQMMAFVLFLLSSAWTKYVSVSQRSSWPEAQTNCRQQYTDLAVISNVQDNEEVLKIAAQLGGRAWIGINWNNTDSVWMWSGGGRVSTFFWGRDEPCRSGEWEILPPGSEFAGFTGACWLKVKGGSEGYCWGDWRGWR